MDSVLGAQSAPYTCFIAFSYIALGLQIAPVQKRRLSFLGERCGLYKIIFDLVDMVTLISPKCSGMIWGLYRIKPFLSPTIDVLPCHYVQKSFEMLFKWTLAMLGVGNHHFVLETWSNTLCPPHSVSLFCTKWGGTTFRANSQGDKIRCPRW